MTNVYVEDKSKSLNENIDMVLKSNLSKVAKRRTLIEVLGISSVEANYFMGTLPKAVRTPRDIFKFMFGVEIEMFCNQGRVMSLMGERGINYQWTGTYHHNNGNRYFDFKHDGSISRDGRDGRGRMIDTFNSGIECVSPVLSGDSNGLATLKGICDILKETNAQTNVSTGLHIHISTKGMTDEWFVNIFKNYQKLESVIDTFMAQSRRGSINTYCRTLADRDYTACTTIRDIQRVNVTRYRKLNAEAYKYHGTIEFRHHGGTTSYTKISNWLSFCAKLIKWSKGNVLTETVTCIDDIPFLTRDEKVYFNMRAEALSRNDARA